MDGGSVRRKTATCTGQHKHRIRAYSHPCLEWDSSPRSQCVNGRRHSMPSTARPLWSALRFISTQHFAFLASTVPITIGTPSKSWTVFDRSNPGVVGSNSTRGMDVCVRLFCVCVVLCILGGLPLVWSPVQGVLRTVESEKWLRPNKGLVGTIHSKPSTSQSQSRNHQLLSNDSVNMFPRRYNSWINNPLLGKTYNNTW
jgi:hypothetical protein